MSLSKIGSLSNEVLLVIYSYLDVKDLLIVRKVSVCHSQLAMEKKLWKWTRILENELFKDEKYFTGKGGSRTMLMNLVLADLSSDDLSWLVCRVTETDAFWLDFDLEAPWLNFDDLDEILRAIIREADEGTSQLKKLYQTMTTDYDEEYDNQLMARALTRIGIVELSGSSFGMMPSASQVNPIFQAILTEGQLELENLEIEHYFLGEADSEVLAGAVARIKTVVLNNIGLLPSQTTAIFQAILSGEKLELENLHILESFLDEVDSELMAVAVTRMRTVHLHDLSLTASQATDICHAIQAADENLELEELSIEMGYDEVRKVDNELLAGAVVRIKTVNLQTRL